VPDDEPTDRDSLRLELQQAIETLRHQATLITQVLGFITAADALLLSYGLSQKNAGILFLASLTPIAMLFVLLELLWNTLPIAYAAIKWTL
jgi:hypothetical protein